MKKIRIGNDFVFNWAIERNGFPENLSSVLEKHLYLSVFGKRVELIEGVDYDIIGNVIRIEVTPTIANIIGTYKAEFRYILPDNGFIDEDRKCAVDVDAFQIVAKTAQADDSTEFSMTSDMAIAFKGDKGDSAYQVWLDAGNIGTEEDYFAYLRQPATDAVSLIEDKIDELDTAIQQEEQRELAEGVRLSNEQSRVDAEGLRVSGEVARNTAEGIRVGNESTRIDNEGIRLLAEEDRIEAEEDRVEAEEDRVEAENIRVESETLRINAELLREGAESDREDAEQLRQTNTSTAIQNANEATQNANSATELANTKAGEANTAAQNADNARLAIEGDLALKANHGYESNPKTLKQVDDSLVQLAGEVEQLAYVKIKNKAVNGNFENGLISPFNNVDGGGGASTLTINSSTPISGNYDIRFTVTTPTTVYARPYIIGLDGAANIGEKIYLHFYAKILSDTPTIRAVHNGATVSTIYGGDVINGRNTRIIDVNGTGAVGTIYFNSLSVWDMQMDNFMRINLTETFGAGNEPTEEEMNLLLDIAGISYIDDEVIIPAQKIMQWQLKLIRKNKNAILALGGTII